MKSNNDSNIPIAIADDHPLMIAGLKDIIHELDRFQIQIEASNGKDLIDKLETAKKLPEICILDLSMPILDGYEALKIIKNRWPEIQVIIISMFYNEFTIIQMLRNGAAAYISKDANPTIIQTAITDVLDKGYYHTELATKSLVHLANKTNTISKINKQEIEFLKHCCSELSYRQISEVMNVSHRTIDGYRNYLFEKLNVNSRVALVVFALQSGLVPVC
jgi:two-component system invasion response regulator UvrY